MFLTIEVMFMRENINILDYLPDVIKEIKEFDAIATAENPEINNLWQNHQKVFDNQFISTLDADGCTRWEKMLNITPKGTATVEDRRLAISARINASLPYTYRQLENFLRNICDDDYTMTLDNANYTLTVLLNLSRQNQFDAVSNLLTRVMPANIVFEVGLKYNQYKSIKPYQYSLLIHYTCYEIRTNEDFSDEYSSYSEIESYDYGALENYTFKDIEKL